MKKILITGIILILAIVGLGTCNNDLNEEGEIEYTDVVYSPDGSQVTVYLDGVTVPVTKAQRAMTRDLATMAYDFLEVIFVDGVYVARASWELGAPAGIYGVHRTNINYGTVAAACLFAGKKDGKTLMGIGQVTGTDGGTNTTITATTGSVMFSIRAIQTGLVSSNPAGDAVFTNGFNPRGAVVSSLKFVSGTGGVNDTGYTANGFDNTALETLGQVPYPVFKLPTTGASTINMEYEFTLVGDNANFSAAKLIGPDKPPLVQRRTPRFLEKGAYREPKTLVNTRTKISIGTYTSTAGYGFTRTVPLILESPATAAGIFSFYLEFPVYMVNNLNPASNASAGGTPPVTWYIRTGYGSELYSLDDGVSNGGCALISIGVESGGDWLNIEWDWVKYPTSNISVTP